MIAKYPDALLVSMLGTSDAHGVKVDTPEQLTQLKAMVIVNERDIWDIESDHYRWGQWKEPELDPYDHSRHYYFKIRIDAHAALQVAAEHGYRGNVQRILINAAGSGLVKDDNII